LNYLEKTFDNPNMFIKPHIGFAKGSNAFWQEPNMSKTVILPRATCSIYMRFDNGKAAIPSPPHHLLKRRPKRSPRKRANQAVQPLRRTANDAWFAPTDKPLVPDNGHRLASDLNKHGNNIGKMNRTART
jgi:hypothetical protein